MNLEFVQDVLGDVSWDKHVAEHAEDDQSSLKPCPRQSLVERLSVYEQKLAALEALLSHRDEIDHELKVQKELLNEILKIQEKGFQRMETGLERTCHHLEMYLTGNAAKEDADFKISEIDDHGSQSKGLLRRLFS